MEKILCKCERCGRIRDLFQYTKFEVKEVSWVENGGKDKNGDTIRIAKRNDIGEKRGLCEECAAIVNSREYDSGQVPSHQPNPSPVKEDSK